MKKRGIIREIREKRNIYIYIGRKKKNRFRVARNGKAHREHDTESTCIRAIYVTTQVDEPTSTVKEKKRKEGRKWARRKKKKEKKEEKKSEERRMATHRNPNRVISSSLFLDGSREPKNTG